jgi:hypothetical protein
MSLPVSASITAQQAGLRLVREGARRMLTITHTISQESHCVVRTVAKATLSVAPRPALAGE